MRIQFHVDGGFAHFPGLNRSLSMDTSSLPASEQAELERLIQAAQFFSRPVEIGNPAPGNADGRTYFITIENNLESHTIRAMEPFDDPPLQALINALRALQRQP